MNEKLITEKKWNSYLSEQKDFYEKSSKDMQVTNHSQHNVEPNYINAILGHINENPSKWKDKKALDFGCGCGRNIKNLLDLADFKTVDGCDISKQNIEFSKSYVTDIHGESKCKTWETNGCDLNDVSKSESLESNYYDFIMSHQVFQHISNYEVRYSILSDIFRLLKPKGLICIHFLNLAGSVSYSENDNAYSSANAKNVWVNHPSEVIEDLKQIGFKDVSVYEGLDYHLSRPEFYFSATK